MSQTNTQPDASRLVYRIKTALKGESVGLETARLAWQYAIAIQNANTQLQNAVALLEQSPIQAYLATEFSPRLLDTVDALDFSERDAWINRCQTFGWKTPDLINFDASKNLREAFADKEDPKDWLYTEYRERARAKKNDEAYALIKLLAEKFNDDANIQEEFKRQHKGIHERAAKELESSLSELIAAESVPGTLAKYRDFHLELAAEDGPIKSAHDAEDAAQTKSATAEVEKVVTAGKTLDENGDWQKLETQYLKCEYNLATKGTRAKIDPKLRDDFNKVGTSLSRARGTYESDILIREAIDQLRLALSGKAKVAGGKTVTPRDAIERIKSLEAQAKKMGHRLTAALQSEIAAALGEAKKKRLPRLAMIGGGAIAVILVIAFSVSSFQQNAAREADLAQALEELENAKAKDSSRESREALTKWAELIESETPDAELAQKATEVNAWIDEQDALLAEYQSIASQLARIKDAGIANETPTATLQLLSKAESLRKDLAKELGNEETDTINDFTAWRELALKQQARLLANSIDRLIKTAIDRVEQARAARSVQSFSSNSKAAQDALFEAQQILATQKPDLGSRDAAKELSDIAANLDELNGKWDALASVQKNLLSAKTLDTYLNQLERIQSFDITPRKDQTAISRVLRGRDAFASLKAQSVLPEEPSAMAAFASGQDYSQAEPGLASAEQSFLERLANDPDFSSVYKSRVQYFEGELAAKSEYYVFLTQPIEFDQTPVKSGTSFTFKVQGFDEFGDPEGSVREMNFLTRTDGTAWGFRYYPSEMSPESLYYEETLRVLFLQVLAGAPRLSLINQLDDLNKNRNLSPAFRAYWQQQILKLLEMNPWKWGLALSPTLQIQAQELERIGRGGIPKQQWLSSIEQTAPSLEFTEYFRKVYRLDLAKETQALARLYDESLKGDFALVGVADASGRARLSDPKALRENKWGMHALTGELQKIESDLNLAPYSPILVYRFANQDADKLFQTVELQTGLDLSEEKYTPYLPPLLQ
ncbi:MAG: hypothetical protein AAGB46_06055 [Verrucomicrobiota bacterium]